MKCDIVAKRLAKMRRHNRRSEEVPKVVQKRLKPVQKAASDSVTSMRARVGTEMGQMGHCM